MNVIFTCGGTAGHVNPALALARYMVEHDDARVLFVGTPQGLERRLVEKAGFPFRGIEVGSFRRSLSLKGLRHNLHTAKTLLSSHRAAEQLLDDFCPQLVVGTGGYASYPTVKAAARRGIPTAVHESNMIPGLTTKLLERSAKCVMVGFEDCREHYRHPEKIVVTGTPVRGDFFALDRAGARQALGISDDRPLVVSFWGSLGASTMNERMLEFFRCAAEDGSPFHHIHAAGDGSYEQMSRALQALQLDAPALDMRRYIDNMATVMCAADLVISRSGASTLSELTALGKPAILVPSPFVVANHQEKNARGLERRGGAVVLLEAEATGKALYERTAAILRDETLRSNMAQAMYDMGKRDATERIYHTLMSLV